MPLRELEGCRLSPDDACCAPCLQLFCLARYVTLVSGTLMWCLSRPKIISLAQTSLLMSSKLPSSCHADVESGACPHCTRSTPSHQRLLVAAGVAEGCSSCCCQPALCTTTHCTLLPQRSLHAKLFAPAKLGSVPGYPLDRLPTVRPRGRGAVSFVASVCRVGKGAVATALEAGRERPADVGV